MFAYIRCATRYWSSLDCGRKSYRERCPSTSFVRWNWRPQALLIRGTVCLVSCAQFYKYMQLGFVFNIFGYLRLRYDRTRWPWKRLGHKSDVDHETVRRTCQSNQTNSQCKCKCFLLLWILSILNYINNPKNLKTNPRLEQNQDIRQKHDFA